MNSQEDKMAKWFLVLGIVLVSFCLRPSLTSIGPLIPMIREDLGLSNGWSGFLTTLPLLIFAVFSLFASRIGAYLGNIRAILYALVILALGIFIRVQSGVFILYFGTALTGVGIILCNVLLIPLIKLKLPGKMGIMTSVYTTGMSLFAAIGSGLSVPFAIGMDLGWRGALLVWLLLIVLAIMVWIPQVKKHKVQAPDESASFGNNVWKSRLAWEVSIYMGLQSLMFFTLVAWLPDLLISKGFSVGKAGFVLSLMQVIGLIGSFLAPLIAVKYKSQIGISVLIGLVFFLGYSFFFAKSLALLYIGLTIVGLCLGASISLIYTLIGLRTEGETTGKLSGMAQSVGYFLAALGPLLVGLLLDLFQNWNMFIGILLVCSVVLAYLGSRIGRDVKV
ncbi:MFS transporter [Echinicola marina]|uniref:CynX/NimT family MFS transporter n=1 Tax=Echinicola marina TaxID=2859768 RepID=UPI001CF65A04|nr:MFS transporter [Echinicola marina]UCS94120.1 MFS transporter [Echinicola marina]